MRFAGKEASECYASSLAAYHASRIVTVPRPSAAAVRFSLTESDCYHFGERLRATRPFIFVRKLIGVGRTGSEHAYQDW
jgi:hypothetical protein